MSDVLERTFCKECEFWYGPKEEDKFCSPPDGYCHFWQPQPGASLGFYGVFPKTQPDFFCYQGHKKTK
jgi:hypothetical protein